MSDTQFDKSSPVIPSPPVKIEVELESFMALIEQARQGQISATPPVMQMSPELLQRLLTQAAPVLPPHRVVMAPPAESAPVPDSRRRSDAPFTLFFVLAICIGLVFGLRYLRDNLAVRPVPVGQATVVASPDSDALPTAQTRPQATNTPFYVAPQAPVAVDPPLVEATSVPTTIPPTADLLPLMGRVNERAAPPPLPTDMPVEQQAQPASESQSQFGGKPNRRSAR